MIQDAIDRIPTDAAFGIVLAAIFGSLLLAGFGIGYWGRHTYVTTTKIKHVEKSWGKPDQTIPAEQVNPQLAQLGLTTCGYYASKHALVCQ